MTRRDSQTAHRILDDLPGVPARFGFGTAQSVTDADGDTLVLPDGIPELTAGVADEELESGVQFAPDPNQPNQPIPMVTVGGMVAVGERVAYVSLPSGPALVLGSVGSQPRLIGLALITGGTANQTTASATDTDVTGLTCEVEVVHPDHLIMVQVAVDVTNLAATAQSMIGRVKRVEESDEGDSTTVEVGRYLRNSALGASATTGATHPVPDLPDPGGYTYKASMESASASGFTIVTNPAATTPLFSAGLFVYDCGPIPDGYTLT